MYYIEESLSNPKGEHQYYVQACKFKGGTSAQRVTSLLEELTPLLAWNEHVLVGRLCFSLLQAMVTEKKNWDVRSGKY